MHDATITHVTDPGPLTLAAKWRTLFTVFAGAGLLAFAGGLIVDPVRVWHDFLIAHFMFLLFAMAGLFFTALQHAVNATWSIAIRRVAEAMTAYLPVAIIAWIIFAIFGFDKVYSWANGTAVFEDPSKTRWLSPLWVGARGVIFLAIWTFFARKLVSLSVKQDQSGDLKLSRKAIIWSIAFMPVFALTFTLTSFDLLMSLEPHWWSTMFGVYCFAGMFQSGVALITLIFLWLKHNGALARVATMSHAKDLGTFLFAFTIFMTYIGFSQYMLIWYANLPEETFYFLKRMEGGWVWLFVALPVVKFAIPFFGLLSQGAKKSDVWLMTVCWTVIFGQYLDIYWMTMPTNYPKLLPISWMEIGTWLMFAGAFGLMVSRFFSKHSVLAVRDPRIVESVNWKFWE